ncbi:fasciclin domain-containing protein [Nonomuraea sp. NPDC005983]|uniref:fasciclin domain-containing protein n=1 Tax=Nonomuraea sp. NPDC005983 TaxID=3155595 RepID=UPI0033B07C91
MAGHRLATAVAGNPQLTTLGKAISVAGLTNRLNTAKDITFLAPVNQAFPSDSRQLAKLLKDKTQLTRVLEYHVIAGKKTPTELTSGPLKTLQGGTITAKASGDHILISGRAKVLCGNIVTKNATVYIIDRTLQPRSRS